MKIWFANNSTKPIHNVYLVEDLTSGLKADYGTATYSGLNVTPTNGETEFQYHTPNMAGRRLKITGKVKNENFYALAFRQWGIISYLLFTCMNWDCTTLKHFSAALGIAKDCIPEVVLSIPVGKNIDDEFIPGAALQCQTSLQYYFNLQCKHGKSSIFIVFHKNWIYHKLKKVKIPKYSEIPLLSVYRFSFNFRMHI